jgi:protoporphyrinogen IX oxidase
MLSIVSDYYLWIKAFHVIFVTTWMAGLFYLPRLFVYHAGVSSDSEAASLFKIMEYRLYKIIIIPSMFLSLAFGFILAIILGIWLSGWFHVKLFCVGGLIVFQHLLNRWRKQLERGTCLHSAKFFRVINEAPSILLVIIVISVIVKPF